jgi:colanic acid/amylovoran biosynthesis glycosyltransferase
MQSIGFLRHHFLPPSETFIYSSLRALTNYQVRVLTLRRDQAEKFPLTDVTVLGDSASLGVESLIYRALAWSPRAVRWAGTVQLLHAHAGNSGVHAAILAQRAGVPLVVSFYGKDVTATRSLTRWNPSYWHYVRWQRWLFATADRLIVLSKDMRQALLDQGAPVHKLRVVPLGVDLSRFTVTRALRSPRSALRVLMVGREIEKKGFDDGLRACAVANQLGAALEITVLGTGGPLRSSLQRLANHLALKVSWPRPETNVATVMAEHDVLLVPSRTARNGDREGTPTVICEGSASGLAVLATRHAGIPEQVEHGRTGWLVEEREVAAMAQHLVTWCKQRALVLEMGREGAAKMQAEFSLRAHGERLSSVYREVLGEASPP